MRSKILLIIMDGLGAAPSNRGNAVTLAQPSNLIRYWDSYPHTYLKASGEAVGLPNGVYGNSEVGHLNIGAGKVILQNLPKINKAIETGAYMANTTLLSIITHVGKSSGAIHLMGCMSDGSVHAHIDHFIATVKAIKNSGYKGKLFIHAFTDGRDTFQKSAQKYLQILQRELDRNGIGHIASLCGRALAMDRNQKWERTKKAYDLLINGTGAQFNSWSDAMSDAYAKNEIDEYIEPRIIPHQGALPTINDGDGVIFMNFRADRAIQISDAIITRPFDHFPVKDLPNLLFAGMVQYRKGFPSNVLMPKEYINLPLGRIVSENGMRQLRIAESEKFPHVTYFFNGGNATKYSGEDRIEIQSPNVPTYDLKPEMSAMEVLSALVERIKLDMYDLIVLNLANTDMVGHTGNLEACIKSVKVVDYCIDQLVKRFSAQGGTVILTADHGNVEEVIKLDTNQIDTEHSLNPVPFIVINKQLAKKQLPYGTLASIAPTILHLMGIQQPSELTGKSLLE